VIQTGTIAAVGIAFAKFMGVFVPWVAPDHYLFFPIHLFAGYALSLSTEQLVAALLIFLLTWTNTRGLETGKRIQNTFTFAKTAALLSVILIGLSLGWRSAAAARSAAWWDSWQNGWTPERAQPGLTVVGGLALALLFGKAMVGPVFAQTAWTNVTFLGGEVRDPGRNLSRALLIGCLLVVSLYLLANLAYVALLPFEEIQGAPQNRVAVAAMNSVFGSPGALAMAAAIMISTFGCNNGLILAGARVYYAMARDRLFFRRIATINARNVPAAALVAQGIWAAFLTLPRTILIDPASGTVTYGNVYTQLLEYIVSADLVFYLLLALAVIVLRRKSPEAERPYRMWGYPAIPVVSLVLAAGLIIDLAYLAPTTSGIGYLLVLSGIPVYLVWHRGGRD
jgi:APA family basic amino acid/polyamine antiporter